MQTDPAPRFDLQSHSTCSDGTLPPADVVAAASAAGVELLALTDHDSVDGVSDALAAADRHGLAVVPAVELSALRDVSGGGGGGGGSEDGRGGRGELHILGYRIDDTDPLLARRLAEFRADRERRAHAIADALRGLGLALDEQQLADAGAAGIALGRPHLAEAALAHPANAARLRAEGITELGGFLRAYLAEGRPAYRPRTTPTLAQAIAAIHDAGGVAVWAHPFWHIPDPAEVLATIDHLRTLRIDGVEAFYITHTREQTELLARRCTELNLLSTGSADFHGPQNSLFSRFLAFETYGIPANLGPIAAPAAM